MIAVSNTTPILSLYKIGRIHLLKDLLGQVIVPVAVYNEIAVLGKDKPGHDTFDTAEFISVKPIQSTLAAGLLRPQLDYGEAEAIVLARELNADILLLDEIKARKVAQANSQRIIGTIGIIQAAKRNGIVPSVKSCLDELIAQGIWIDRRLYQEVVTNNNE